MGLGIAESLADLYGKLTVAQRQLDGAKSTGTKGGGKKAAEKSRKIQSLESQVRATRAISKNGETWKGGGTTDDLCHPTTITLIPEECRGAMLLPAVAGQYLH